jgi:hypothetical protein
MPLKIWWTFKSDDNDLAYNLTTGDGIMVTRPSAKISMLAIEALKPRHRGNYSCYWENKAATSVQSAFLSMNGSIVFFNSSYQHQNAKSQMEINVQNFAI